MIVTKTYKDKLVRFVLNPTPRNYIGIVLKDLVDCLNLLDNSYIKERVNLIYIEKQFIGTNADDYNGYNMLVVYNNGINQILYKRKDIISIDFAKWLYCEIIPELEQYNNENYLNYKLDNTLNKLNLYMINN